MQDGHRDFRSDRIGFSPGLLRPKNGQIRLGSGEETIILVHGFGLNSKTWIPFLLPHLKGRTFVAVDLPGHGSRYEQMPDAPNGYLEQFAFAIQQAISRLESPKVALVGYSIGAFACLQYLQTFGSSRISKYLHIDHSPFPGQGWEGAMDLELIQTFENFLELGAGLPQPIHQYRDYSQAPQALIQAYYEVLSRLSDVSLHPKPLRAFDRVVKSLPWLGERSKQAVAWPWAVRVIQGYHSNQYDFRASLKNIDVATWIMGAARNKLFPLPATEFMAREIPGAKLHILPGGHEMQFGSPLQFNRVFSEFLKSGAQ